MKFNDIDIKAEILKRKAEIIKDIQEVVAIPSWTLTPGTRTVLKHVLAKGQAAGYKSHFVDGGVEGISGHLHWGNEKEFLGILGHLDTVPVEESKWDFQPYGGEITDDGFLLGRGTQDDKGPMIAAYHAVQILKDLEVPLSKGVRLIFGTQEEGGQWSDIQYYFKNNPLPQMAFTPDSHFPLIFAEKGILRLKVAGTITNDSGFTIKGGLVPNAVPSKCDVSLNGENKEFTGTALHAMMVWEGCDSAAYKALHYTNDKSDNQFIQFLVENFVDDPMLKRTGIGYETELEGPLSCNLGVININAQGETEILFDIRWPQGSSHQQLLTKFRELFKEFSGLTVTIKSQSDPLFIDPKGPLVSTLENVYREVTGDQQNPLQTSGGGTYARAIPNCIAFGMMFPGDPETLHQKNEKIKIESLLKGVEIYCKAIYQLAK